MDTFVIISKDAELINLAKMVSMQRKAKLILIDNDINLTEFEKNNGFSVRQLPAFYHTNSFTQKRILKEGKKDVVKHLRDEQFKINF